MELQCDNCGTTFKRRRSWFIRDSRKYKFCSNKCAQAFNQSGKRLPKLIPCQQCGTLFGRRKSTLLQNRKHSKSNNLFCSKSCAATYNNLHKTHGTRRSKLEVWLEEQLRKLYPDLEIMFNAKEAINSELDIHFPSLNLAFELNGIYHYEPIHGTEKLASIQTNDHRKFAACAERGIALCIIDVSTMKNFKPTKGQRFLDIIVGIVEQKIRTRE